jgi:hypothetical protein
MIFFPIQLDESTSITGKAKLLGFSEFICNGYIIEQLLFCKLLPEITKGQDILDVDSYLSSYNLSWRSYIIMCMNNAPTVLGSVKGFVTLTKQKNPRIVSTQDTCAEKPSFQNH